MISAISQQCFRVLQNKDTSGWKIIYFEHVLARREYKAAFPPLEDALIFYIIMVYNWLLFIP